jgi:hypothetical protein
MKAKANLVWRNQKLEFMSEKVDKSLFDLTKPCLKVNDRRSDGAIYKRKADVVFGYGYLIQISLPDVSYDVLAAREIDALDVFQHFLPMMEIDIAKHLWAVLKAKQMSRKSSGGSQKWLERIDYENNLKIFDLMS